MKSLPKARFHTHGPLALMHNPADLFDPPFAILRPGRQTAAAVLDSPHSGSHYPQQFLKTARLQATALRRSEDCYVDELFASAVDAGAPLLKANFPRAFLDLNREPNELDPHLIEGPLPRTANASSVRVAGGLGTIPRVVSEGEEIYRRRITLSDALARIAHLYDPYHAALAGLMSATSSAFGAALLIDCHSMPSSAASSTVGTSSQPDIVIGDRHGSSTTAALIERHRAALSQGRTESPAQSALCGRLYHRILRQTVERFPRGADRDQPGHLYERADPCEAFGF